MPKKGETTFAVVSRNYDDPDIDDEAPTTWVEKKKVRKRKDDGYEAMARMMEDGERYEMQMAEDEAPREDLFDEGQTWNVDFDQNFIRELDKHDNTLEKAIEELGNFHFEGRRPKTELDEKFEQELKDYDSDEVDKDDPHLQGPLDVEMFKPAMQEFYDDTRDIDFCDEDDTGGTLFQRSKKELQNKEGVEYTDSIFHKDSNGVFLTVLPSKKSRNLIVEYRQGLKESNKLVKQRVLADPEAAQAEDVDTDELFSSSSDEESPVDVESVASMMSTTENRPTVIRQVRSLNVKKRTHKKPMKLEEEVESSVPDHVSILTSNTTAGRPTDETSAEKRERKKLLHEAKRLRKQQKKQTQATFGSEERSQRKFAPHSDMQKRTIHLGV